MTNDQMKTIREAISGGKSVKSPLFDFAVEGDELTIHVKDPSHPTGLRSWRWFDVSDVTDEYATWDSHGDTT